MCLSCTVSVILSLISQNLKRSLDAGQIPFGGHLPLVLYINKHTKFEMPSLTNSIDMIGGRNLKKNWSRDLDHAN